MISEKIHRLRIERRLTQEQLALLCGYTRQWINQVELNQRKPSRRFIKALCKTLRVKEKEVAGDGG